MMNVTLITAGGFTIVLCYPVFAIVTSDSHANSILISHVTGDIIRHQSSFTIRINDIMASFCYGVESPQFTTRLDFW